VASDMSNPAVSFPGVLGHYHIIEESAREAWGAWRAKLTYAALSNTPGTDFFEAVVVLIDDPRSGEYVRR